MINKAAETHALLKARLEGAASPRPPRVLAVGALRAVAEAPPHAIARPAHLARPAVEAPPPAVEEPPQDTAVAVDAAAPAEPPSDAPADTRRSKRRTTRIGGFIALNNGQPGIFCSVRDMSATGALLSLNTGGRHDFSSRQRDVPNQFWLQMKHERMQVHCQVIRRTGSDEIGVRFLAAPTFF